MIEVWLVPAATRPPPWGDRVGEWSVGGVPNGARTQRICEEAARRRPSLSGVLVVGDDVALELESALAFLDGLPAVPQGRAAVAAMGHSTTADRLRARSVFDETEDGGLRVPLLWSSTKEGAPRTHTALIDEARAAHPVLVDPQEECHLVPAPRPFCEPGEDGMRLYSVRRPLLHLQHRTHLLQANLGALGARLRAVLGQPKWRLALAFLWDRLRFGRRRLLATVGHKARIHPTAIVEASEIGDGVEVGAYAIVRGAIVGAGATIEEAAQVTFSVVGPGARVAKQTAILASVLMEGAHSAQAVMQLSVLGRHSVATSASWFSDVRFDGPVRVEHGAGFQSVGSRFLGCDAGHHCVVGAGVIVAPGRLLPSHAIIVSSPASVVSRIDAVVDPMDAGGRTLSLQGGTLVPLTRVPT